MSMGWDNGEEAAELFWEKPMSEVDRLRRLDAGIGDILEGTESNGLGWSTTDRIKITAIGEERFLCRWDFKCRGIFGEESGSTTLSCRDWKKVT